MKTSGTDARERGSSTAEFAVLMPAVCLVLAMCLGGLQLATQRLQLYDAAALAARSAARGGDPVAIVSQIAPEATIRSERRGNLVCILVNMQSAPILSLLGLNFVSATGCALADGR